MSFQVSKKQKTRLQPAATSNTTQTQWWRLSQGLPQKQIYTIHHPENPERSRSEKYFFRKKTAVSNLQKKNSWFLGWRFIPNINTVPTLQGPQLPRVTTCEAMVVTRIPGSQRLVGCYLTLSKSVLLGRANKVLTCFFSQQPTCNSYTIRTTLNTCPATKGHQSSKIKELETSTT